MNRVRALLVLARGRGRGVVRRSAGGEDPVAAAPPTPTPA